MRVNPEIEGNSSNVSSTCSKQWGRERGRVRGGGAWQWEEERGHGRKWRCVAGKEVACAGVPVCGAGNVTVQYMRLRSLVYTLGCRWWFSVAMLGLPHTHTHTHVVVHVRAYTCVECVGIIIGTHLFLFNYLLCKDSNCLSFISFVLQILKRECCCEELMLATDSQSWRVFKIASFCNDNFS